MKKNGDINLKNKVIVLGSLAYDYIMAFEEKFTNAVSIDHEKEEYQSTVTAKSRIQYFGGTAGNISYNLGLLNIAQVALLGAVGRDFESLGYKDHMSKFTNIHLNIDIHDELFTAACYIVNDVKSNQMIIFHGGAMEKCTDIELKQKLSDPENYLYAINSTQAVDAMASFAEQLSELKIPIIFDPGQVTPLFPKQLLVNLIEKSEILIGNRFEIKQIVTKVGMSEEELMRYLRGLIITKGSEGSELLYKDESNKIYRVEIPIAKPKEMSDATGAGDGYRAGILSGLILNMTLLDSCRLGSIIGSFVIETHGPQTHSFKIQDVNKRFFETYGYTPQELENLRS